MKIRAITIIAGPTINIGAGKTGRVSDEDGQKLIDAGAAELVPEKVEAADQETDQVQDLDEGNDGGDPGPDTSYGKMKVAELEQLCTDREIAFDDGSKKADLILLLEADDADNAS